MAKTTKSQARTKRERSEFLWGWLFILPTTIGLIVLNIIPIFQTIYQSFFKTGDFGKEISLSVYRTIRRFLQIKRSGRH